MISYDILIIGHPSKDTNVEHTGESRLCVGGAVIFSVHSAVSCSANVGAVMKYAPEDVYLAEDIPLAPRDMYYLYSESTVSIRNEYLSADRERRLCEAISVAEPVTVGELPPVGAKVFQLASLMRGDFDPDVIIELSKRGKVAVDAQGLLRCVEESGIMVFRDWPEKEKYLPYITYFKADAAEAEILTGFTDTRKAAALIREWGAAEVLVSHNTEMLVCASEGVSSWPVVSRNTSGRTGRGDTIFAAYITERQRAGVDDALRFATAAVSLKMETPTPLKATRSEIEAYMREFLPEK